MKNRTEWQPIVAFCVLLLVGSGMLLAACGGKTTEPTELPPTDTVSPPTAPPDTPTPAAEGTPAQVLATSGQEVFAAECAECHGQQGEGLVGPALFGEGVSFAAWNAAQNLYNFVHQAMPQDAPGSLPDQQYLEVVTYLLLQNALVEPDTPVSLEGLGDIPLK